MNWHPKSLATWLRSWQEYDTIRRKPTSRLLALEVLEERMLPASNLPIPLSSIPIVNPVSSLTAPLLSPVTGLLNPLTSSVSPLLGSIVNPLLSSPLLGSVVSPVTNGLITPVTGPVTNLLPSVLATAGSLPNLVNSNVFQPTAPGTGSFSPAGGTGFGGTTYNPGTQSTVYFSTQNRPSSNTGGFGASVPASDPEFGASSGLAQSGGFDSVVTVGLGEEDDTTTTIADLQAMVVPFADDLSIQNMAATLLTGVRPRASLLPQRGSQVAPVATLLSDDALNVATSSDGNDQQHDWLIKPTASSPGDCSPLVFPTEDQTGNSDSACSSSAESHEVKTGRSFFSGLLISGFVAAILTWKGFRARRDDFEKNKHPSLAQ
jgi:hypothetical protein